MSRFAIPALVSAVSALVACTGTDTGNPPVIDFGNSGCHDQTYAAASALQSLDKSVPDPLYKGLTCLTWQHVDPQTLRIDLTNYESGCGTDDGWTPLAKLREDGGLDLVLQDDDCSQAGCGWCIYDLSFTVQLDRPLRDGDVRVYQQGCGDEAARPKQATLALSSLASGAVCNYSNGNALFWRGHDEGGSRMPCLTNPDAQQTRIDCQPGLVCTDLGESNPIEAANAGTRCLPSCNSDADCGELTSCQQGVCKLTTRGLSSN
jgi:hypothetical protein